MLPITGLVICYNEADRIKPCVQSLRKLCADVVVLDSGSTDATVDVARAVGAQVMHQPWLGYGAQKNAALEQATQPWVLFLDADEWLSPAAQEDIQDFFARGEDAAHDAMRLPRRNYFLGAQLKRAGLSKEWSARLFRKHLRYEPTSVHEKLLIGDARLGYFSKQATIEHHTARSYEEQAAKLENYAELWAQQRYAQGKRSWRGAAELHAAAYWLKQCLLRGGMMDGALAMQFHGLQTRYVWQKYRRLREKFIAAGIEQRASQV